MKIIDIGICVNNNDPQGIGRIRYRPYGQFTSEIEHSLPYNEWDENDQFIAIPFLPPHINVIPQIKQSVKIIKYDTSKDTQNVEYVAGPFATPHNFGSEVYTTQHKFTTYGGTIVKNSPAVRDKVTGEYIDKKSPGTLSNLSDTGIFGNYGSDLIFSENGVIIRGGKLVSKDTSKKNTRQKLQDIPILSDKISKINLKKYPQKLESVIEKKEIETSIIGKINYIVEYELNNLLSPTAVNFYVYKVINPYTEKYNTDTFNETTEILPEEIKSINLDNLTTGITATVTGSTLSALYSESRNFLLTLHNDNLNKINPKYNKDDMHPFYFRPTRNFRLLKPLNDEQKATKLNILNAIKINRAGPRWGLYFSKTSQYPPTTTKIVDIKKLKVVDKNQEQTFAATTSDKIYFISTDSNKGDKNSIDFTKLDKYEYTRDNYLSDIHPNTYALVRGEILIKLLNLMYKFLTEHKHNINDVPLYKPESKAQLDIMIYTMESFLINQSIRIN